MTTPTFRLKQKLEIGHPKYPAIHYDIGQIENGLIPGNMDEVRSIFMKLLKWVEILAIVLPMASTAYGQIGRPHYKSMSEAIAALHGAKDEDQRKKIYPEIGSLSPESPDQLLALHDEIAGLEKQVQRPDQNEYSTISQQMSQAFLKATGPSFADALAEILRKEYSAMPKDFAGPYSAKVRTEWIQNDMRMNRLVTLTQAIGQTKNRQALPILRKMLEDRGIAREMAAKAIGQIGDPADLDDIIRRIKHDPKARIFVGSFGPTAVDRVMQEIDNPTTSQEARATLSAGLRDMATHENLGKFHELLKHKNQEVQEMAADGICTAAATGDEDLVIEVARDSKNMNRLCALRAMDRIWNQKFVPVLQDLLMHDQDQILRGEAARSLGAHKVREALPDLERAASDSAGEVRRKARAAIENFK